MPVARSHRVDRSTRRTTRQETRRQLILDAAASEFAESGYEGATLERIGERVGLSKASIYYYVAGKEHLFASLLERFVDDVEMRVRDSAANGGDAVDALTAVVAEHLAVVGEPLGRALVENQHVLRHGVARVQAERYERIVAGIVEDGITTGRIRRVPVRPAVKLVMGAMNGVGQWFSPAGKLTRDEVVEGVVGVLLRGFERTDDGAH